MAKAAKYRWALLAVTACTQPATAVVVAVSTDAGVAAKVAEVKIEVFRRDNLKFSNSYAVGESDGIPGTLTLRPNEESNESESFLVRIQGVDQSNELVIERKARLGFVKEKVKLLRLPLYESCLGQLCQDQPGTTCIDGTCQSENVDSSLLPDFIDNVDALKPSNGGAGQSQAGAAGGAGEGGSSVIGGSSGASGTGAVAGVGGTGGTGAVGGTSGSAGASGNSGTSGTSGTGGSGGTAGATSSPIVHTISAGDVAVCAIGNDGKLYCWGYDAGLIYPDTPYHDPFYSPVPVEVSALSAAGIPQLISVAVGWGFGCVIAGAERGVYCWGANNLGQCGTTPSATQIPTSTPLLTGVLDVKMGLDFACAILDTPGGNVVCWGNNSYELFPANLPGVQPITPIAGIQNARKLAIAHDSGPFCALQSDGAVMCWGRGVLDSVDESTPSTVGFTHAKDIGVGGVFADWVFALDDGGIVWTSKRDVNAQSAQWLAPSELQDGEGTPLGAVDSISVGAAFCALVSGDVKCVPFSTIPKGAWQHHPIATGAIEISAGAATVSTGTLQCARAADSKVYCWGDNGYGDLGNGKPELIRSAVNVSPGNAWANVLTSSRATFLINGNRAVFAYGSSYTLPSGSSSLVGQQLIDLAALATSADSIAIREWYDSVGYLRTDSTISMYDHGTLLSGPQARLANLGFGDWHTAIPGVDLDVGAHLGSPDVHLLHHSGTGPAGAAHLLASGVDSAGGSRVVTVAAGENVEILAYNPEPFRNYDLFVCAKNKHR